MEYLRTKVSGNKKRYVDEKYNLDLSYINPRVIAMAFPASGFRKLYRNSIDSVAKFLDEKHSHDYLVINLSGITYDYKIFGNRVKEYEWIDHQAPKLVTLFLICKEVLMFLLKDPKNIVAINCRAGKGRTGTVISCFMLFIGIFSSPEKAMNYYSKKRFNSGEGVTQPSQRRYIMLFNRLLKQKIYFPTRITIENIYINKIPTKNENEIRPFFNIYHDNNDKVCYTSKKSYSNQRKIYGSEMSEISIVDSEFSYEAIGDITISIYNNTKFSEDIIGRVTFNTAFLDPESKTILFNLEEVDPDNLIKKKDMDRDFSILVGLFT